MKIIKTTLGTKKIKISKSEWEAVGLKQGWIKQASLNVNDNIEVLVDALNRGFDISAFKVNPYSGMAVSTEEIAEAQNRVGGNVQQQGQNVTQPPPVEKVAKFKKKLIASETKEAGLFSKPAPTEGQFGYGLNEEAMNLLFQYDINPQELFKYDTPNSTMPDIYEGIQQAKNGDIESLRNALEARFGKKGLLQKRLF